MRESVARALSQDIVVPEFGISGANAYPVEVPENETQYVKDVGNVPEATSSDYPPINERHPDAGQHGFQFPPQDIVNGHAPAAENHSALGIQPDMLLDTERETGESLLPGSVRILGQYRDSYIIACDRQGLLIIDQHVAHERILYEKLANSLKSREVETQGLLNPFSLDLAPHHVALIEKVMPELKRSGFHVEPFGGASVIVRSVPAFAGESDCRDLLKEIFENLNEEDRGVDIERIRDRIAVTAACRSAVKVNMPLSMEKMQWLIDQLAKTRIPTRCPHGRPIILRFSNREIEKKFGRA